MENQFNFYLNKLNTVLAKLLNSSSNVSQNLELRSKLGLPMFFCSLHDPLSTMKIITTISKNAKYSPQYSIILVACGIFCLQYIPVKKRKKIIDEFSEALPKHIIPDDIDQFQTISTFFNSGGAQKIPCKKKILEKFVNHPDPKISLSPKLINSLISDDIDQLAPVIYEAILKKEKLTSNDLFLIGQINSNQNLPKPTNTLVIDNLYSKCNEIIHDEDATFFDKESALTCLSAIISWDAAVPSTDLFKIDNTSLLVLAIFCFNEYIKNHGIDSLSPFPDSQEKAVKTAYFKLISTALQRGDTDIKKLREIIPHWFLDALIAENEEYETEEAQIESISKIVLTSPSIYDLSSEDITILGSLYEFTPLWMYVHVLRINTKNAATLRSCISIVKNAPKTIIDSFFEDFMDFLDKCINFPEIVDSVVEMINDMTPVLTSHFYEIECFLLNKFGFINAERTMCLLNITNAFAHYKKDKVFLGAIFDIIMESFNYYLAMLSPSFLNTLFTFFINVAEIRKNRHTELMMMALAVASGPFDKSPPPFITQKKYIQMFNLSHSFFSSIQCDIVANPLFSVASAYPPLPTALILISKLTNYGSELDNAVADIVLKALDLCPYQAAVAAKNVKVELRDNISKSLIKMLDVCDVASFNVAVEMLTNQESTNILSISKSDDIRFLISNCPDFVPQLFFYPEYFYLMFEEECPPLDSTIMSLFVASVEHVTPIVRWAAKNFNVEQPKILKYSWSMIEFGDKKLNTEAFAEKMHNLVPIKNYDGKMQEAFDQFRILYPVKSIGNLEEEIVFAMKNYRKYKNCKAYLKKFFTNKETPKILEASGNRLWILSFGSPYTKSYGALGNDKCKTFAVRNGMYEEKDDQKSIKFIERIMKKGPNEAFGVNPSISPSLFYRTMFYSNNPDVINSTVMIPESDIPSFKIRHIRSINQYIISKSKVDDVLKENINLLIANLQVTNPIIASEGAHFVMTFCNVHANHSFAINMFFSVYLRDTHVNAAWVYDSLPLINKLYKELSIFESGKSLVKKFYSACCNANIDLSEYPI